MKVYRITNLTVAKVKEGLVIHAEGLTTTPGWSSIELKIDDPNPEDRVLEISFEGKPATGIVIQVLAPVSASAAISAENIDAILVKARTNSLEVHASDFQSDEKSLTTLRVGEEHPPVTTWRIGEEHPPITTWRIGEEEPNLTTKRVGEEGPPLTTLVLGEEGPLGTDIRVDDPAIFASNSDVTTLAIGEENGGNQDPRQSVRSPFGNF